MDMHLYKTRLDHLQQMIFEMAQGNFTSRISLVAANDDLKALEVVVNMLAEELQSSVSLTAYTRRNHGFSNRVQSTLLLDDSLSIVDCTPEIPTSLGEVRTAVVGQNAADYLTATAVERLTHAVQVRTATPQVLHLDFRTTDDSAVPVACRLARLKVAPYFVLHLEAPAVALEVGPAAPVAPFSPAYFRLIRAVYDYVLAHLAQPLPHLRTLARLFGTNEHKLKAGFKHCFDTSVYQFYHEERLKRSFTMVQQTLLPLHLVAEGNGFRTYPNFCRAFKKRFGISASDLRRQGAESFLT